MVASNPSAATKVQHANGGDAVVVASGGSVTLESGATLVLNSGASVTGTQMKRTARSVWFNLDNGAGTTIDDVIIRPTTAITIIAARIVYQDATTGTVAAGSAQIGTTVGGTDIVAATNYENAKAVGTSTAMVIASGAVAANTPVIVRHTGVAVTQAGQAVVEIDYTINA